MRDSFRFWSLVRYHVLFRLWFQRPFVTVLYVLFCIVGVPSYKEIPFSLLCAWFLFAIVFFHFYLDESRFFLKKK